MNIVFQVKAVCFLLVNFSFLIELDQKHIFFAMYSVRMRQS